MWHKVFIIYFFTFFIETESTSLYLLVGQQFFILLLVTYQIMFFEAALVQVALGAAIKYALKVTSALCLLMYLKVLFKVTTRCKLFRTIVTLKRFFTGMYSLMPDEVGNLTEGLLTSGVVALIGLLLVVYSCMFLE